MYETSFSKQNGRSRAKSKDLLAFAERALCLLKQRCPQTIVDGGLNRVDIMFFSTGQMVVNEFESLEACYAAEKEKFTCRAQQALQEYWLEKLNHLLL